MKLSVLSSKRNVSVVGLVAFAVVAIFAPSPSSMIHRSLAVSNSKAVSQHRRLAEGQCEVIVSVEQDFEGPDALNGWTNGKLEASEEQSFTKFLGRYGKDDPSPEKAYDVDPGADIVYIELDFYEIDIVGIRKISPFGLTVRK
jgi:hypothetical protein